ncbi:MAG TPA: acetyl-CoA carboxylase biotin carboxylase subunit [Cryomorphaceae bacterium]|nr:acetyl-CoA carboxylase biotin carboxylase subunit [Owenweeksia sp.]HAD98809.1 acetyl-CoA carboxylase biotin carboxylase subunit [Cryomorphaceae bacterium]HBF19927.1 acetyl-CoA carboxylase biotin carboxylase subunit [Cryomorphaceae bacterium]
MNKILVANRGEIALRVMKSAREMGIQTVAVYSEADRNSPHVKYADEAVLLGPPPSNQSYLLGDTIIEVCKKLKVDAIHPGYGFLSENADFADKVEKAGITFIGPSSQSMRIMGDKLSAKEAAKKFDIPLVPGTEGAITDVEEARSISKEIGFPVLIKASAGGGGKGMRIVRNEEEVEEQMKLAVSEAKSAFGDGSVFIEKYVSSPRHIEIQVLCDKFNNQVHLFERECSIQRRHQKVVEEAPSSVLTPELREKMGQTALDVARSCEYIGAGTVEFILDENRNYYFLEMNTRLQVEHPVTEMITNVDLVKEQIKVARNEKLSFKQEDLSIIGHAIEVRVYAENPMENFLPDIGNLKAYQRPHGTGVRVDDGFEEGMDIPIYYDPMISKLVTYGKDREEARKRMIRACEDYVISGVQTTLSFGKYVMEHPRFIEGDFDTHFVDKHFDPKRLTEKSGAEEEVAAAVVAYLLENRKAQVAVKGGATTSKSSWKRNRTS